ncbi:MAG: protein-L-isoaspartate(D-aspartate) O-methyltransferase [Gammaproteobacteria bacterium]|nr:protein-L-isoaspartate(D-aspartate) O-methyltransferase [Gammaproteobacteria bacterium]
MIDTIVHEAALCGSLTGCPVLAARVLQAMRAVPRAEFVPEHQRDYAYDDRALSIGAGQTISQPFIVALMTQLLDPQPGHTVLEVGTGSGYQAAVLSHLVKTVYSIEIIDSLAMQAGETLSRLGYHNVHVQKRDGGLGLPEHAPYDSIIVTAAAQAVPPALLQQLKPGGRLVIPVGHPYCSQSLQRITRGEGDHYDTQQVLSVIFVPLTGATQTDEG